MDSRGISKRELVALISALLLSLSVQLVILPSQFVGPDTNKFLEIAEKQLTTSFWGDPQAFDGNYWSVGYPTFLATILRINPGSIEAIQVVQTIMAAGIALIVWTLAFHLGPRVRVLAAVVAAFSPTLWAMGRTGGYEILLSTLLCGSLAAIWAGGAVHGVPGPRWWRMWGAGAVSGLLLGLAILVQSKSIIVLPVVFFLAWRSRRSLAVTQIVGLLVALLPWIIRNKIVREDWSPFNTNGPINVWIGNNPDAVTGGFMEPPPLPSGSVTSCQRL